MTSRYGRRGPTWVDDARGGIRALVLEALIVIILIVFALAVAFLSVTVV